MTPRRIDVVPAGATGGALVFIACLYTSPAHLFPLLAPLRPALVAAALMLAALVIRRVVRGERWRLGGGAGAGMATLFGLSLLSFLWAIDPTVAGTTALGQLKLPLAFLGILGALTTPAHVRTAMATAAACALVPAVGTLQRYHDGVGLVEGYRAAWIGLLANPNELAMVMAVTVPWALATAERARGLLRVAMYASAGLACAAIVATHSRGGTLGLGMGFVTLALVAERRARAVMLVLVAAGAMVVFAPRSFWERTQTIRTYEQDASALGRLRAWENGFEALSDRPLLGVGAGNYSESWNNYTPRNPREHAYSSHNMWMQVVVELGVAGLVAYVVMLGLLARQVWRARRSALVGREARAALASLAALITCGTTAGYAFNWFFYMTLGVAAATAACARDGWAADVA